MVEQQPLGGDRIVQAERDRRLATCGHLGHRALHEDLAAIDDRSHVADLLNLVQQVGRQEDRAAVVHERADELAKLDDAGRVESVGRFIEDQELRFSEQAAGDPQPLAHPHRIGLHPLVGALGQADPVERALDPGVRLGLTARCRNAQVLPAGQMPVEARRLDDRTHPLERLTALLGDRHAEQPHLPAGRRRQAEEHADERRLASAVRAQEPERDPGRDPQIGAVQRDPVTERLGQAACLDHQPVDSIVERCARGPSLCRPQRVKLAVEFRGAARVYAPTWRDP